MCCAYLRIEVSLTDTSEICTNIGKDKTKKFREACDITFDINASLKPSLSKNKLRETKEISK
jgi:hypothetical protein